MGNSTKVWRKKYDINFHSREAKQAVVDMGAWREGMAKKSLRRVTKRKRTYIVESDASEGAEFVTRAEVRKIVHKEMGQVLGRIDSAEDDIRKIKKRMHDEGFYSDWDIDLED